MERCRLLGGGLFFFFFDGLIGVTLIVEDEGVALLGHPNAAAVPEVPLENLFSKRILQ